MFVELIHFGQLEYEGNWIDPRDFFFPKELQQKVDNMTLKELKFNARWKRPGEWNPLPFIKYTKTPDSFLFYLPLLEQFNPPLEKDWGLNPNKVQTVKEEPTPQVTTQETNFPTSKQSLGNKLKAFFGVRK